MTRQREEEEEDDDDDDDDDDENNNHTMKSPNSAAAAVLLVLIEDKNLCSSASEIRVRVSASEGERVDRRYEVRKPGFISGSGAGLS